MRSDRKRNGLTKAATRRRWKLQVMKSLSGELGTSISDIRRTLGKPAFDRLLDEAYEVAATDPEAGTKLVRERILGKYGAELGQGTGAFSGKRRP